MKKLITLLLLAVIGLTLVGCSNFTIIVNPDGTTADYDTTTTIITTDSPDIKSTASAITTTNNFTPCDHEYKEHYGFVNAISEKRLVTYYTCSKCNGWFDSNKTQIEDPTEDTSIRIESKKNKTNSILVSGKDYEIFYNDELIEEIKSNRERCNEILESQDVEYSVLKEIDDRNGEIMNILLDDYNHMDIAASMFTITSYYEMEDDIYAELTDMYAYNDLYEYKIASTKYRNDYYVGYTEEEIDAYVADLDPETSQKASDLSKEMNSLVTEYQNKTNADIGEYFVKYKKLATQYAALYDYDTYLDFEYENVYEREYEVEDALTLKDLIKQYIIPVYNYLDNAFTKAQNSGSAKDYNTFVDLYYNTFYYYRKSLQSYAETLGGKYLENYNGLFESGNYYLSNIENDNTTAYSNEYSDGTSYLFLGNSVYQSIGTFIHEFGHYNAGCINSVGSFDLAETQSQGNECLFYTYAKNTKCLASASATNIFSTYQLDSMVSNIIIGYICNYVEYNAWTSETDVTKSMMQGWWNEMCDYFGFDDYVDNEYWEYTVLENSGYYISYSTSANAALQLYAMAKNDYSAAIEAYTKIYDYPEGLSTFTEVIENAGLVSVFNEQAYKNIYNAFFN